MLRKRWTILIAAVVLLAVIIPLCGCGDGSEESFTGELIDAQNGRIVVRGDTETYMFVTTAGTVYDIEGDQELYVGDEINVEYHKTGSDYFADSVKVTNHDTKLLVIGGDITDLTDTTLTVRAENLSVRFSYDSDTKVEGRLNKGDTVTVTYEGDLSRKPHAVSIIVIQEQREEALASVQGTVSELAKDSMLLSIDSADAWRISVTRDTIITGDDTKMKVGDVAEVVYTGTLGENPVARNITITRQKRTHHVMDGLIENVTDRHVTISTSKKSYKFKVSEETRYENMKYLIPGHKSTITYTGDLDKEPEAVIIYCSKEQITAKEKQKEKKETEKKATEKKETQKKATQKKETGKEETKKNTKAPVPETEPSEDATDEPDIEPTDEPDVEPADEPDAEPADEPEEETEAQTEPEDEASEETPEEATEESEEESEEDTKAPSEDPANDPEDDEGGMTIIKANATIQNWASTGSFKVDGGGTLKLDTSDASVASGYFPQEDDQVLLSYDQNDMKLLDIQLVYRPAADDDDDSSDGSDEDGSDGSDEGGSDGNDEDDE